MRTLLEIIDTTNEPNIFRDKVLGNDYYAQVQPNQTDDLYATCIYECCQKCLKSYNNIKTEIWSWSK